MPLFKTNEQKLVDATAAAKKVDAELVEATREQTVAQAASDSLAGLERRYTQLSNIEGNVKTRVESDEQRTNRIQAARDAAAAAADRVAAVQRELDRLRIAQTAAATEVTRTEEALRQETAAQARLTAVQEGLVAAQERLARENDAYATESELVELVNSTAEALAREEAAQQALDVTAGDDDKAEAALRVANAREAAAQARETQATAARQRAAAEAEVASAVAQVAVMRAIPASLADLEQALADATAAQAREADSLRAAQIEMDNAREAQRKADQSLVYHEATVESIKAAKDQLMTAREEAAKLSAAKAKVARLTEAKTKADAKVAPLAYEASKKAAAAAPASGAAAAPGAAAALDAAAAPAPGGAAAPDAAAAAASGAAAAAAPGAAPDAAAAAAPGGAVPPASDAAAAAALGGAVPPAPDAAAAAPGGAAAAAPDVAVPPPPGAAVPPATSSSSSSSTSTKVWNAASAVATAVKKEAEGDVFAMSIKTAELSAWFIYFVSQIAAIAIAPLFGLLAGAEVWRNLLFKEDENAGFFKSGAYFLIRLFLALPYFLLVGMEEAVLSALRGGFSGRGEGLSGVYDRLHKRFVAEAHETGRESSKWYKILARGMFGAAKAIVTLSIIFPAAIVVGASSFVGGLLFGILRAGLETYRGTKGAGFATIIPRFAFNMAVLPLATALTAWYATTEVFGMVYQYQRDAVEIDVNDKTVNFSTAHHVDSDAQERPVQPQYGRDELSDRLSEVTRKNRPQAAVAYVLSASERNKKAMDKVDEDDAGLFGNFLYRVPAPAGQKRAFASSYHDAISFPTFSMRSSKVADGSTTIVPPAPAVLAGTGSDRAEQTQGVLSRLSILNKLHGAVRDPQSGFAIASDNLTVADVEEEIRRTAAPTA
ncbi:MAG TPA: hypothetical protein VNC84_06695 [Gammaproteobacteria bacterium]|jgi:hypothetical protein|nr:hypothetical protein [Gammaproteobacteria bacterium]